MATMAGVNLSTPRLAAKATETPKLNALRPVYLNSVINKNNSCWNKKSSSIRFGGRFTYVKPVASAPDGLSEKVVESIKQAKETCSDDPASGECVAAWDEVEELSAAVSHAKDKKKDSDPLETYCKDNPETDECRTYDN